MRATSFTGLFQNHRPRYVRQHFIAIHEEYIEEFQPSTPAEKDAIVEMVTAIWRHHRFWGVETAAFNLPNG